MAEIKPLVIENGQIGRISATDSFPVANTPDTRWRTFSGTFARASDASFTVTENATNQAIFSAGRPLMYRATGGTWFYGIVKSYSSGTVTICGAALTTDRDDEMQVGSVDLVRVVQWVIPGNVVVADPYSATLYWQQSAAYCVRTVWKVSTAPTGSNITATVKIAGSAIHSNAISLTAGSTTEVDSGVNIGTGDYDIQHGETLAITLTQVGSTVSGGNPLTVSAVFVLK